MIALFAFVLLSAVAVNAKRCNDTSKLTPTLMNFYRVHRCAHLCFWRLDALVVFLTIFRRSNDSYAKVLAVNGGSVFALCSRALKLRALAVGQQCGVGSRRGVLALRRRQNLSFADAL